MKNNRIKGAISTVSTAMRVFLVGNLETQVHLILDKNKPTDLDKAFVLVRTRDILSKDKRWKISYRSKKGAIQLVEYSGLDFSNIFTVKRIVKYRLGFEYLGEEYKRFDEFASRKGIYYKEIYDSLRDTSIKATTKYFKYTKQEHLMQFV